MEKNNKVKSPKMNMANTEEGLKERIEYIENHYGTKLEHITNTEFDLKQINGNIESFIGGIEIPVGMLGPIQMNNKDGSHEIIHAPVATSEGALVASMSRGAYAITLSGGFYSKVIRQRMSRCPMFCFQSMKEAEEFASWVNNNYQRIKEETKKYSNYAELVGLDPQIFGRNIHLKFDYETGDASGQNMTTTCTWNASLWIEKTYNQNVSQEKEILNFVIEANGSSDKKLSAKSRIATRGTRVIAEAHLPEKIVKRVLKASSQDIVDLYLKANAMAVNDGMSGYNVNVANAVAAFYAATGQDLACIHESAVGILQMEKTEVGLYCAITLPSLVIGTVGGGTGLKGPKEILKVIGCQGSGKSHRLAKIIAGYALGLELSTMAAITSGQFATSHERLGRNRPVEWLKEHELTLEFFQEHFKIPALQSVTASEEYQVSNGIVSEVTAKVSNKPIGFFPFHLNIDEKEHKTILKLKPLDQEILLGFEIIAGLVSPELKSSYELWKKKNAFQYSHKKEIIAYKSLGQTHAEYIPKIWGTAEVTEREIYAIAMEYLSHKITHLNSENSPELWTIEDKGKVIKAIAKIHGDYYHNPPPIKSTLLSMQEKHDLIPFYELITKEAHRALSWMSDEEYKNICHIIERIDGWYEKYLELPMTFIHNDCSPRNICMKDGIPCLYDWELCEIAPPQRDFVEFMAFTMSESTTHEEIEHLIHNHYAVFLDHTDMELTLKEWKQGVLVSAYEFLIDRITFYMIGNIINQYSFLQRVYISTMKLITILENDLE